MRLPRVRLSVRQLMGVVAVVAVLTPFPLEAVVDTVIAAAVWVPIATIAVGISGLSRVGRASVAVVAVIVSGLSFLLLTPAYWEFDLLTGVVFSLTPPNLAGPIYAAWRVRQGRALVAGEVLWAWQGVVWSMLLAGWHPHHQIAFLDEAAQCTRLTVVLAVLLALYGPRPARPGPAWGHYVGWWLVECDAIAWGWYASRLLRWNWGR